MESLVSFFGPKTSPFCSLYVEFGEFCTFNYRANTSDFQTYEYDIGPFSTGSTQKVTWVSFGEFHDNTGKRAHDKTHPVHSVLCRTNVRFFIRTYCTF